MDQPGIFMGLAEILQSLSFRNQRRPPASRQMLRAEEDRRRRHDRKYHSVPLWNLSFSESRRQDRRARISPLERHRKSNAASWLRLFSAAHVLLTAQCSSQSDAGRKAEVSANRFEYTKHTDTPPR